MMIDHTKTARFLGNNQSEPAFQIGGVKNAILKLTKGRPHEETVAFVKLVIQIVQIDSSFIDSKRNKDFLNLIKIVHDHLTENIHLALPAIKSLVKNVPNVLNKENIKEFISAFKNSSRKNTTNFLYMACQSLKMKSLKTEFIAVKSPGKTIAKSFKIFDDLIKSQTPTDQPRLRAVLILASQKAVLFGLSKSEVIVKIQECDQRINGHSTFNF